MKEVLKVSGVLNIVISGFYLLVSFFTGTFTFACFLFLLTTGILFLNYSKLDDLSDKKTIILVLSIMLIPLSLISALINLFSLKHIKRSESERAPNVDPETKRIDSLIKVGVALITLSGIIFISSSWNNFSGYIVLLFLVLLTGIFYGLYKLFTLKIKLVSSRKLYYILTNIFLLLIYLTLGHYDLLGSYFSTTGVGSDLFYSIFWIIASILTYNLKVVSESTSRIYFSLIFITFSVYNLLIYFGFNILQSLVIINILVLFIRHISKNIYVKDYLDNLIKIFIAVAGVSLFEDYSMAVLVFVIINIIVINYLNMKNNIKSYEIYSPIVSIFYSMFLINKLLNSYMYNFSDFVLVFISFISVIYIIIMCTKVLEEKIVTKRAFVILYNFIFLIFSLISMFLESYILLFVIIIRVLILFSYYFYEYRYKIKDFEYYLISVNITMLMICTLVYLNNYIDVNANIVLLSIIGLLSCYYVSIKNIILGFVTFVLIYILNFINIFVSIFSDNVIIVSLTLLSCILPFILQLIKDIKVGSRFNLVYGLITSFIILFNGVYGDLLGIILNLILYLTIFIIYYDNDKYAKYIMLLIVLPLFRLVGYLDLDYIYNYLINNILFMYMLFIIVYKFIESKEIKINVYIIFSSLLLLFVIFMSDYIFGIYVGIISLVLILYSSMKDNLKSLFNYGVILMAINVFFRLRSIWYRIPLWGYLLLAGLTIIIFATIKEIKKDKK